MRFFRQTRRFWLIGALMIALFAMRNATVIVVKSNGFEVYRLDLFGTTGMKDVGLEFGNELQAFAEEKEARSRR